MSFAGVTRETAVAQMYVDDPATDPRGRKSTLHFYVAAVDGETRGGADPRRDVRRVRVRVPPSNVSRAVYTSAMSTHGCRRVHGGSSPAGVAPEDARRVALRRPREASTATSSEARRGTSGSSRRGALGGVDRLGGCRARCRPGCRLWPRAVGRHPTRGAPRDGARAPRGGGEGVGARRRDGSRRALETRPTAEGARVRLRRRSKRCAVARGPRPATELPRGRKCRGRGCRGRG